MPVVIKDKHGTEQNYRVMTEEEFPKVPKKKVDKINSYEWYTLADLATGNGLACIHERGWDVFAPQPDTATWPALKNRSLVESCKQAIAAKEPYKVAANFRNINTIMAGVHRWQESPLRNLINFLLETHQVIAPTDKTEPVVEWATKKQKETGGVERLQADADNTFVWHVDSNTEFHIEDTLEDAIFHRLKNGVHVYIRDYDALNQEHPWPIAGDKVRRTLGGDLLTVVGYPESPKNILVSHPNTPKSPFEIPLLSLKEVKLMATGDMKAREAQR